MDELVDALPPELKQAVETHGFHKVAAAFYGVPEITEKVAIDLIGRRLVERLQSRRTIAEGLSSLDALR